MKHESEVDLRPRRRLNAAQVFGIKDRDSFLEALSAYVAPPGLVGDKPVGLRRGVLLLTEFCVFAGGKGIGGYLMLANAGRDALEVRDWCKRIGADATVNYIEAAIALFPSADAFSDDDQRTDFILEVLMDAPSEPLLSIDREHEPFADEVADGLRVYARKHRAKLVPPPSAMAEDPDAVLHPFNVVATDAEFVRMLEKAKALGIDAKNYPDPVLHVGDLVEIETVSGLAYVQVTHDHALRRKLGPVVRVFDLLAVSRPADVMDRAAGGHVFFAIMDLEAFVRAGRAAAVGTAPLPPGCQPFPSFKFVLGHNRAGSRVWAKWEGGLQITGRIPDPLSTEQCEWPLYETVAPELLGQRLAEGWRPTSVSCIPGDSGLRLRPSGLGTDAVDPAAHDRAV